MHPRATSWPSPPQGGARRYVLTTCVTKGTWDSAKAFFLWKAEALQRASEPGSYLSITCPTGETTHWILRSLMLPYSTAITDSQYFARHCVPSSTAVTDSLDFQVADAPLQIQFASAKCVHCASTGKRVTRFSGRFAPLQHGYHRLTIFCASLRSFKICSLV